MTLCLICNFQKKNLIPNTAGWNLYCAEKRLQYDEEGLSGNKLVSRLGQDWRVLSKEEKKKYQRKAFAVESLKIYHPTLQRSKSSHTSLSSKTLPRQKSLPPM